MVTDKGEKNDAAPVPSSNAATTTYRPPNKTHDLDEKRDHARGDLEEARVSDDHPSGDDGDEDDDVSTHNSEHHSPEVDYGGDITPPITRLSTNVSLGPDNPVDHYTSFVEVPDAIYDRIPNRRKLVIVALLSYCSFLAPISSTTVLSATPEVAAEFNTTGSIIDVTNALYMLFMGISPIVWGPFSEVWGRRMVRREPPKPFSWNRLGADARKHMKILVGLIVWSPRAQTARHKVDRLC